MAQSKNKSEKYFSENLPANHGEYYFFYISKVLLGTFQCTVSFVNHIIVYLVIKVFYER